MKKRDHKRVILNWIILTVLIIAAFIFGAININIYLDSVFTYPKESKIPERMSASDPNPPTPPVDEMDMCYIEGVGSLRHELSWNDIYVPAPVVIEQPVVFKYANTDDLTLLATLVMAEADGECEEGRRLVIDTVLNRVEDPRFPNTIREVIFAQNQFECIANGRFDRCYVKDDILKLVKEEMESRHNSEVLFFQCHNYSKYGTPMFQVGNHYFCK